MRITDVRKTVGDLWTDTLTSWQDDMSRKFQVAIIDQMDELLKNMQDTCSQMMIECEDVLRRLKEIQDVWE